MRRHHLILGRAVVLIIVGAGIGLALYLARHLSPDSLERQVREALRGVFAARFTMAPVVLDLDSGVELQEVKVFYPDGEPALEVERILLYVDKEQLLRGEVVIPQVTVSGVKVRMRPEPEWDGLPGLPGIFRPREGPMPRSDLPLILVEPGSGGSRIEIEQPPFVPDKSTLNLTLESLEGQRDGERYALYAELAEERLGRISVRISYDHSGQSLSARSELHGVDMPSVLRLAGLETLPTPAAEVRLESGHATGIVTTTFALKPLAVVELYAKADVERLAGTLGDRRRARTVKELPRFEEGGATLKLEEGVLHLHDVDAVFVNPRGERGSIEGGGAVPLTGEGGTALRFKGKNIALTTDDLRLLLRDEEILDRYNPAGTFDVDLSVAAGRGAPTLDAIIDIRDGRARFDGPVDEDTGRRLGFPYPLERMTGRIRIVLNAPTPWGAAREVTFHNLRGHHPIREPRSDGPKEADVTIAGRIVTYGELDPSEPEEVDLHIRARNIAIDEDVEAAFLESAGGVPYRNFEVDGDAAEVAIHVLRHAHEDDTTYAHYDIHLAGCRIAYKAFPLHAREVSGLLRSRTLPPDAEGRRLERLTVERMTGLAEDGGRMTARGTVEQRADGGVDLDLDLAVQDLELGRDLKQALAVSSGPGLLAAQMWDRVRPSGMVNAKVHISDLDNPEVVVDLGGRVRIAGYERAECPLTDLSGRLILSDGVFHLDQVQGKLGRATLTVEGDLDSRGASKVETRVRDIPFDDALRALVLELFPEGEGLLELLRTDPESHFDLLLKAQRATPDEPMAYEAAVTNLLLAVRLGGHDLRLRGRSIRLVEDRILFDDLRLEEDTAWIHLERGMLHLPLDRGGRFLLEAGDLHPDTHLSELFGREAVAVLGDDVRIDLSELELSLRPWENRIVVAGAVDIRRTHVAEEPREALEPVGAYELSPLTVALPDAPEDPVRFFGLIRFRGVRPNLSFGLTELSGLLFIAQGASGPDGLHLRGAVKEAQGSFYGRRIEEASFDLEVEGPYVHFQDISATFYAGRLSGSVEANLAEPHAFEVDLRLREVDLGLLTQRDIPREESVSGILEADLVFSAPSDDLRYLSGRGRIAVREGALLDIPFLRPIFAVLRRVTPLQSRPRFNKASMDFDLKGEQMHVDRIHLSTAVNDIYAYGTISLYGDLDLKVDPQVTKVIDLPRFFNIPVLSKLLQLWHRTVYEPRLGGTLDNPQLRLRALPFLGEPRKPYPESAHPLEPRRMPLQLFP